VRLEDFSVFAVVALIGGEAVGAIQNSKEIGQQIDQHSTEARGRRRIPFFGRGMINVSGNANKSRHTTPGTFFPLAWSRSRERRLRGTDDHATTSRASMPDMRHQVSLANGRVDEFVRGEAYGLS